MFPGYTIYLANYRGFGGSSGAPTEQHLFTDALRLYDHITSEHAAISAFGRSLGTGVASFVAANRPLDKLALVTPYDSVERVAQARYPIFPIGLLLKDKFDSWSRASSINADSLILIAGQDRVIPPSHGQRLARALKPGLTKTLLIPDADHHSIVKHPLYFQSLEEFFMPTSKTEP